VKLIEREYLPDKKFFIIPSKSFKMDVAVVSKSPGFGQIFWVFYYLVIFPIFIFLLFRFIEESLKLRTIQQPAVQQLAVQKIDLNSNLMIAREWMIIDKLVDEWNYLVVSKNLQHPIINKQELRQLQMSFGQIKTQLLENIESLKEYILYTSASPTVIVQIEKRKQAELTRKIFSEVHHRISSRW